MQPPAATIPGYDPAGVSPSPPSARIVPLPAIVPHVMYTLPPEPAVSWSGEFPLEVLLSPEASTEPFTVTVPDAVTRTHPPPLPPRPHVLLTPLEPGSTGAEGSSYGMAVPYSP